MARGSQSRHDDCHHAELCQLYQLPRGVAQDSKRETQAVTEVVQVRDLVILFVFSKTEKQNCSSVCGVTVQRLMLVFELCVGS